MPLSKPAIIGIVVAAIVFFVLFVVVLIIVLKRKPTIQPVLNVNGNWIITAAGDDNLVGQSISVSDSGGTTIAVTLPPTANIAPLQMSVPSRVISNLVATFNGPTGSYTFNTTNGSIATFSGSNASQSAVNYTLKKQ